MSGTHTRHQERPGEDLQNIRGKREMDQRKTGTL